MLSEQQIIQTIEKVQNLLDKIADSSPDWYASLRISVLEFERRLKVFKKRKFKKGK